MDEKSKEEIKLLLCGYVTVMSCGLRAAAAAGSPRCLNINVTLSEDS